MLTAKKSQPDSRSRCIPADELSMERQKALPCVHECGNKVARGIESCPHCGGADPYPPPPPTQKNQAKPAALVILFMVGYCCYCNWDHIKERVRETEMDRAARAQAPRQPSAREQREAARRNDLTSLRGLYLQIATMKQQGKPEIEIDPLRRRAWNLFPRAHPAPNSLLLFSLELGEIRRRFDDPDSVEFEWLSANPGWRDDGTLGWVVNVRIRARNAFNALRDAGVHKLSVDYPKDRPNAIPSKPGG